MSIDVHDVPLCVDLDGTLVRSDLLFESAFALLRRNPAYLLMMLIWLLRGRAFLKREIAARVDINVSTLPYDKDVVTWLYQEAKSRQVLLCTAADRRLAEAISDHVGVFEQVIASDGHANMAGSVKAKHLVARFGDKGFDYVGDSEADLAVWKHARMAVLAGATDDVMRRVQKISRISHVFSRPPVGIGAWLRALRPHQWTKNVLVLLPLFAAHLVADPARLAAAVLAALSFSACASSVYLVNDLLDLEADRLHPQKCTRPFAAGQIPLWQGIIVAPTMALLGIGIATASLPISFVGVLVSYYVITLLYSFRLKRVPILDVVVLAALYTLRIIGGTAAIATTLSFWLLTFSMFVFLSLALLKRYSELLDLEQTGQVQPAGRGYRLGDLSIVQSMGCASGYISVLVMALYINSPTSQALYRHPELLWFLCPVLLYWISRAWLLAHHGNVHHDPVVFALNDAGSRMILLAGAAVILGATF